MDKNYDIIIFISKYFISKKSGIANSADIIKIAIMFIKKAFKESKKVKRIRKYILKYNLYLHFLI